MPDLDSLLELKIHKFPEFDSVNKYDRSAYLECPTCLAIDDFYNVSEESVFRVVTCKGGLELECSCGHEHEVTCAGVLEKHFHVGCMICKSTFLLHLPEKK